MIKKINFRHLFLFLKDNIFSINQMKKFTGKNSQVKSKVKEVKKKIRMNTCCVLNSSDFSKAGH